MKRYGLIILCMVLTGLSVAHAQNTYYFPQVANGSFVDGSFKTTLVLDNSGSTAVNVTVQLTSDAGDPFSIFPGLESGSFMLGPGSARTFQSDGTGPLVQGAATITSNAPLGATAIFSQFDISGRLQTEAGVTSAPTMQNFTIPVDLSNRYNTGVAFFKPGAGGANITLDIYDEGGAQKGHTTIPLGGTRHTAKFVPDLFPALGDFGRGSLVVSSDASVAAVALRSGPGLGPVITTLPVSEAQTAYNFPQIANGSFFDGSFKSLLILNNSSGTATANVTVQSTNDQGQPFSMFPGLESGSVTLPPHSTRVFQSNGTGPLTQGAARISANNPVIAAVIFSQYDINGNLQTEAGVTNARPMRALTIPVDLSNPFNTGVALFKQGSGSADVTFRLLDTGGALRGTASRMLVSNGHTSAFVADLFGSVGDLTRGSLSISSSADVAAVALRLGAGVGPVITTLPVIDGAYIPSGGTASFAGSFDGSLTPEGASTPAGTLTLVMRQSGNTVTGRVAQEISEGGCIVASEFTGTLSGSNLQVTARALDGISPDLMLNLTLSADQTAITGTFSTRACLPSTTTGRVSVRKLPASNPPDLTHTYIGGVWNVQDTTRSTGFIRSHLSGRDFIVDEIGVTTPIGLVTGTARGRLNDMGDRVENLVISLAVAGSTLTLNGEASVTSDGGIIFGGLQTNPGELIDLKGSLLMRKQ